MLRFLTAGESHGPCLLGIVEGMPAGLPLSEEDINPELRRRQVGYGRGERMKIEQDRVEILSGMVTRSLASSARASTKQGACDDERSRFFEANRYHQAGSQRDLSSERARQAKGLTDELSRFKGIPLDKKAREFVTTGAPIALRIENRDWEKGRDLPPLTVPRPGHADLAGATKYGLDDLRPVSERASARETAMRVAIGAIAKRLLAEFGIAVISYVNEIGGVIADIPDLPPAELFALAEDSDVRCPDAAAAERMRRRIDEAKGKGDSLGGVFTVVATGVPIGLGSHVHWDRRLDGRLAQAVMSIPAIKGVEIGPAFENARKMGTEVHDEIFVEKDEGRETKNEETRNSLLITRYSNRAGGIEGGISNGQPIVVRAAMKPIPTTVTPLRSVDLATGEPAYTQYQRSDICAVPAAAVVGEAMVAWMLADALTEKLGGDSIDEMRARWK